MKRRIITFSIFTLAILLIFSRCKPRNADRRQHGFATREEFKNLSRKEQVKKCGSCHEAIYKNEMLGPHANAWKNLRAHIDFINSTEYDCAYYKGLVKRDSASCYGCHTSTNMYESVFRMNINEGDYALAPRLKKRKFLVMRSDEEATTGTDCITCHFNGSGVVAGENFKASERAADCPAYCKPRASKFFSSNANCQPCHEEQFNDVFAMNSSKSTNITCASCHEEKNAQGKYTHYTYWAHNPKEKAEPENLDLFSGVTASYLPQENVCRVTWCNKLMPHRASVCTELVAVVEIKDGNRIIKQDTIRLNRRDEHIAHIRNGPGFKSFPGISGFEFSKEGDSVVKEIVLPPISKSANYNISITGIKKEQYWLNDSINSVYFKKSFQL